MQRINIVMYQVKIKITAKNINKSHVRYKPYMLEGIIAPKEGKKQMTKEQICSTAQCIINEVKDKNPTLEISSEITSIKRIAIDFFLQEGK